MMTSKLFLAVWGVSALMTATHMWADNSVTLSLTAAIIGGGLFSAVVTFIWSKIEPYL